jgi:membrane-associated protease RseP (regulator of RpoE activity)
MAYLVMALGLAALVIGHELMLRRARQRFRASVAFVVAAVASYLAICAIAFVFLCVHGQWTGREFYAVGEVMPDMPATGKLEVGDRIVAVDGAPLDLRESLVERVNRGGGQPVAIGYERDGERGDVTITPTQHKGTWVMGIKPRVDRELVTGVGRSIVPALKYPVGEVVYTARWIRQLVPRAVEDPSGPVAIYDAYNLPHYSDAVLATQWLLLFSVVALIIQLVVDAVRLYLTKPIYK